MTPAVKTANTDLRTILPQDRRPTLSLCVTGDMDALGAASEKTILVSWLDVGLALHIARPVREYR